MSLNKNNKFLINFRHDKNEISLHIQMGGSILPLTIINGKVYLLFGKERDIDENPGWSDFGGGQDKGETFFDTAQREAGEELTGFLGSPSDIKKLLTKYGTFEVDFKSNGFPTYRVHIFPMIYDPALIKYYNNNQAFLQKHLDKNVIKNTKIFEKTKIKWFPIDSLLKSKKQFRSFYQNIIDLILERKNEIKKFAFSSLKNNNKTKRRQFKKHNKSYKRS
jgi:8-oxo-dGTP pyrophosphatase MutT (NUDIX family)